MAKRLTKKDKQVIRAFIGGKSAESRYLQTDGKTLDILGFGGRGVARRSRQGNVCIRDLGSKTGERVGRAVRRETPKSRFKGWCN